MFKNLFKMLMWKHDMEKQSRWFEKHEPAQARFEENEEWLEELEDRIIELEADAHPPKPLCCFEDYEELINKIQTLEKEIEKIKTTVKH